MTKAYSLLFTVALFLAGCQRDADEVRPRDYDILALDTGHWEWERTSYFGPQYTPATEGYSRQLVFKATNQLAVRRSSQSDLSVGYRLAVGPGGLPTITYHTGEDKLGNNDVKYYSISQQNGQQILQLVGEGAAYDAGGYEQYHWVKD